MYEPKEIATAVTIESPFAGDIERNNCYLDMCILDCLQRGETPYASHRMLTAALDDSKEEERELGIKAGLAMSRRMDKRLFYLDLGYSSGMEKARAYYEMERLPFEERSLGPFKIGELNRIMRLRNPIGVITVTRIDVLRSAHGPDKLILHTKMPNGCYPFVGFATAQIEVAHGKGTIYCENHFGDVPCKLIKKE